MRHTTIAATFGLAALTLMAGCKDTAPPTWPQDAALAFERAEKGTDVALRWPAATDDAAVTGYELVRDQEPPVALGPDQTDHTFEQLADAAEHTFSLRARDEAGNWSEALTASLAIPDVTPPTWPVERFDADQLPLSASTAFKLRWEPAADKVGIGAYVLTRKDSDFRIELGPEVREHTVEGQSVEGDYQLVARDAAGNASAPLSCNATATFKNQGLLAVLGSGGPKGLDSVMGGTGLGGELEGAIGNMFGDQVGDAGGFGGLGLKGTGSGGGGVGTIGLGTLGTRGRPSPPEKVPGDVTPSVASTTDGIDAAAARRAMASRRGAFKACYEKRLKQDPDLSGSLELTFSLADGEVTQVEVSGGSLTDEGTRACVRRVMRRVKLPGASGTVVMKLVFQKS